MPRQRVESEPEVRDQLSQLRQIASVYANPDITPDDIPVRYAELQQTWWSHTYRLSMSQPAPALRHDRDWAAFLESQLSEDELLCVCKFVFKAQKAWIRSEASVEHRKRFESALANLGHKNDEMVFFLLGSDVAKSWTSLRDFNSLVKARDPTRRHPVKDVLAAINTAALDRHNLDPGAATTPPEILTQDVTAAFMSHIALRPGEEPGRASRQGSVASSEPRGSSVAPVPPLPATPVRPEDPRNGPASRRQSVDPSPALLPRGLDHQLPGSEPRLPPALRGAYMPPFSFGSTGSSRGGSMGPPPLSSPAASRSGSMLPPPRPQHRQVTAKRDNPDPDAAYRPPAKRQCVSAPAAVSQHVRPSVEDATSPYASDIPFQPSPFIENEDEDDNFGSDALPNLRANIYDREADINNRWEPEMDAEPYQDYETDHVMLWFTMSKSVLCLPMPKGEWGDGDKLDMVLSMRAAARVVRNAVKEYYTRIRRDLGPI